MTEPAPKLNVPKTGGPFVDAEATADPEADAGMESEESSERPPVAEMGHETIPAASGPCADCARYARIGYVAGCAVGIAAGGLVAYVILRNRLNPISA